MGCDEAAVTTVQDLYGRTDVAVLTDDDFPPGVFAKYVSNLGSGVEQGDPKTQGFENRGQSPADMPPPNSMKPRCPCMYS